jgi:hypothetical protein
MVISLLLVCGAFLADATYGQTTEFKYQGSLTDGASPANGNYDFELALYDALNGGNQVGATLTRNGVVVTNGIFAVQLDFGNQFPGALRYLEIHVRVTGQPGFTPLTPRQLISSTPYNVKSLTAETATNALSLGGVAPNQYVQTGDARLTDARSPTGGSTNYIQNGTAPQASSNFNISGNGTVGGNMIANGNVGIGTEAPSAYGHGGTKVLMEIKNAATASNSQAHVILSTGATSNVGSIGSVTWAVPNTIDSEKRAAVIGSNIESDATNRITSDLTFWTNNAAGGGLAEKMRITSAGNVGIGTTDPISKLEVNGGIRASGALVVGTNGISGGNPLCYVNPGGGLIQISPCGSSLRFKKDVADFGGGLNIVNRLRPISFTWKDHPERDLGLAAEEVAGVEPRLITRNDKGEIQGVKYDRLTVVLINAIKAQQQQIEQQQKQIKTLLKSNSALGARVRSVERSLRKRGGSGRRR